jgi:hypothetical protein
MKFIAARGIMRRPEGGIRFMARNARSALFTGLFVAALLVGCADDQIRLGLQRAGLNDPVPTSDAEAVFAEAYRLEQHAAFGEAVQYYNIVTDRYPTSPLAGIAQERVTRLNGQPNGQGNGQVAAVAAPEPAALAPGDYVCTAEGLYPNQARWCGRVRRLRTPYVMLEVTELHLNSWLAMWFSASTCTGDRTLSWFSRGAQVWVPRRCLDVPTASEGVAAG